MKVCHADGTEAFSSSFPDRFMGQTFLTEVTGIWVDCLCLVPGLRQSGSCTNVVIENSSDLKTFNFKYGKAVLAKYLKCLFILSVKLTEMRRVLFAG